MRILFISVWSFESGIFQSTIPPTIEFWIENNLAEKVEVITFGETSKSSSAFNGRIVYKTIRTPFPSNPMFRFLFQLKSLFNIARNGGFQLIWARSVTPGNLAYLTSLISRIPFGVESFEPHTDYMIEGGAWKPKSLKSIVQHFLERRIARKAKILVTVSDKFKEIIQRKFNRKPNSTFSMQCAINFEKFKFNLAERVKMRDKLSYNTDDNVGIYVGKFGDIYYDKETFNYIHHISQLDQKNKFIIITEMVEFATAEKKRLKISDSQLIILTLPHSEVSLYLSAADYGICPVKESTSRQFCSPIKTGEYFASGLPVIISRGIGEDSDFIEKMGFGKVIDFRNASTFEYSSFEGMDRSLIADESHSFRSALVLFSKYISILKQSY